MPTRISCTHPSGYASLLLAGTVLKVPYDFPNTLGLSLGTGLQRSHRSIAERQWGAFDDYDSDLEGVTGGSFINWERHLSGA
jgi:hypothetical protein